MRASGAAAQYHCHIFQSDEENSFEYTVLHNEYRQMVERLLAGFLRDTGIASAQFEHACELASDPKYDQVGRDAAHRLVVRL
jgi:hypothetical protein